MSPTVPDFDADLPALHLLAGLIAFELAAGDTVLLRGDLGAGKTTFARALIRQAAGDPNLEVPSPTFSLVQTYATDRVAISHFDLYRLASAEDAGEIGLDDAIAGGAALIEWPERTPEFLPDQRLEIVLAEGGDPALRRIRLTGHGRWRDVIARTVVLMRVLVAAGWTGADVAFLQGDASPRRYARVSRPEGEAGVRRAILMDSPRRSDGPVIRDNLPYSRIAHLAEDVRPFLAVGRYLKEIGLSAPEILAADPGAGVLLIEDLGDRVFGAELARGGDQRAMWRAAVEALVVLHGADVPAALPVGDGSLHIVPRYDRGALGIEVELLADWYIRGATGADLPAGDRAEFLRIWDGIIGPLADSPETLVLRDYHSPNLIDLPNRSGAARVGIIDFQDAMIGPAAYDLVSLLQDARLDVPAALEHELLQLYLAERTRTRPDFDAAAFVGAYAALGAQRNTKILGIFARLAIRDGKPGYLRHIPRIWGYLERNLAHVSLSQLEAWYDRVVARSVRQRLIGQ